MMWIVFPPLVGDNVKVRCFLLSGTLRSLGGLEKPTYFVVARYFMVACSLPVLHDDGRSLRLDVCFCRRCVEQYHLHIRTTSKLVCEQLY